ncbi:MAG: primase [Solirubrobacterales bacterium]|nr:primase [Solirubrobacterales bacterium]
MSRYVDDAKEKVRDAVDMLELVSVRTELSRKGHNSFFGRCPFHEERTASFHVRPDEKHYHCFGCGVSGDPFDFVMETEGLGFKEALESLAQRYNVTLEAADEDPRAAERRARTDRLLTLLDRAASYYARCLWDSDEAATARSYLLGRGLAEETLRAFRVGYAPSAWDRLLLASRRAGFSDAELVTTGLASRSQSRPGSIYDRFRERVIFPLADERGRVRGFGARAMRDNQPPKYLNTSEGDVFHKREQLFGIDVARREASRAGRVVLAEGYTDVLALHQAGVPNTVGIMGTSLTEEQASVLKKTAPVLLLALDADRAGQEAMLRAAQRAEAHDLELRVVPLPDGLDPADLLERDGPEAIRALVERSEPFVVFRVDRILAANDLSTAEGRDRAMTAVRPVLAAEPPSVLRMELVRKVAGRLQLPERLEATLVEGNGTRAPAGRDAAPRNGAARPPDEPLGPAEATEQSFLAACLLLGEAGRAALADVTAEEHFTSALARRAVRHLAEHATDLDAVPADDPDLAAYLGRLRGRFAHEPVTPLLLSTERCQLELYRLDRAIVAAARDQHAEIGALANERERVRRQLQDLLAEAAGETR